MKYIIALSMLFVANGLLAQPPLKVIKATSKKVAINDGGYLDKNAWTLSPQTKLDVFTADRTRQNKWVTFHTDIDSIRVKLKPGMRYNFVILLNGKDSCYTQIASAIPPGDDNTANAETHDTIPFTLSALNAIWVKARANDTTVLNLHFDASSFEFRLTRDAVATTHLTNITKLQMGSLVWNNPGVVTTGFTSRGMDGRFGWNVFEGKIVEINYDNMIMVIHSTLPKTLKGYVRANLQFIRSFPVIAGMFTIHGKKYNGTFLLDTGADQPIIVDSSWAAQVNFPNDMQVIKTQVLKDPRGAQYETRTVLSPLFTLNSFETANVPTLVLGSKNPVGFAVNYLGNGLLNRFNIIMDFKHDRIYLKANKLMKEKFGQRVKNNKHRLIMMITHLKKIQLLLKNTIAILLLCLVQNCHAQNISGTYICNKTGSKYELVLTTVNDTLYYYEIFDLTLPGSKQIVNGTCGILVNRH